MAASNTVMNQTLKVESETKKNERKKSKDKNDLKKKSVSVIEIEASSDDGVSSSNEVNNQPVDKNQQILDDRLRTTLNLIQLGILDPREGPIMLSTRVDESDVRRTSSFTCKQRCCIIMVIVTLIALTCLGFFLIFGKLLAKAS